MASTKFSSSLALERTDTSWPFTVREVAAVAIASVMVIRRDMGEKGGSKRIWVFATISSLTSLCFLSPACLSGSALGKTWCYDILGEGDRKARFAIGE